MKYQHIILIVSVVFYSGCGIKDLAQDTRDSVIQTNEKLGESNQKQENLLTTTKALHEETIRVQKLTTELVKGMNITNEGVHLQIMTVALQQMLSAENTQTITPPARMMPYADTFAKEARPDEIIQIFHTFITDVIYGGTTEKGSPTEEDLRIKGRRVSLTAAGLIAAFTSEEKVQEILKNQIEVGGRFEDTAYVFALCRYQTMRDFLFASIVEKSQKVNVDSVKEAGKFFSQLKTLAKSQYSDRLKLKVPQFVPTTPDPNSKEIIFEDLELLLDPKEIGLLGKKALRRFKRDEKLKAILENTPEGKVLAKSFEE